MLSTAITGLTEIVSQILDLLGDLINQIIKLLVPDNLDFIGNGFGDIKAKFDLKFGSFLSLGTQISSVFRPISVDFATVIQIDILGASFNPDLALLDSFIHRFRSAVSVVTWLYVAIFIFKKFTGSGDIINDN